MDQESKVKDVEVDMESEPKHGEAMKKAERDFSRFYNEREDSDLPMVMKKARRRRGWLYLMSTLVVLLVAALAALYVIQGGGVGKFGEEKVHFTLSAPAEIPSGQVVTLELAYEDDQSVALTNMEVNVRYPDGFRFESAEPLAENVDGTRFMIKRVDGKSSGKLSIKGQLVGEVDQEKQFGAVISYEPESLSAQYSKTLSASTKLVASVLNLELTGPTQLPMGQPLVVSATYKNSSINKLTGLAVRLTTPGGFELEVPQLEAVPNSASTWRLPDLDPKGEGKVEFKGKFTDAATPGTQELKVAVGLVNDDGSFTVQEEKFQGFLLVRSTLTLDLTINDVSFKSAVDLGQEVVFQMTYANGGEVPFTNIELTAKIDPKYFDWSSLRDNAGGKVDPSAGTIHWTSQEVPSLASLSPGSRGVVRWSMYTVNTFPPGSGSAVSFKSSVEAVGKQLVGGEDAQPQDFTANSNEIESRVNTRFTLSAEGRYFSDGLVKLGSGPLPPKVGETTTYVMVWRLGNSLNEVDNVEVTTTLPDGVNWTGQSTVTAGQNLTYNPNTRQVRWQLNRLPAGAGASFAKPEATFEVAITPEPMDADKILVLTKTTTATAHDTFSEANLIATAKFITTEIDDDLAAQGKGVVIR